MSLVWGEVERAVVEEVKEASQGREQDEENSHRSAQPRLTNADGSAQRHQHGRALLTLDEGDILRPKSCNAAGETGSRGGHARKTKGAGPSRPGSSINRRESHRGDEVADEAGEYFMGQCETNLLALLAASGLRLVAAHVRLALRAQQHLVIEHRLIPLARS